MPTATVNRLLRSSLLEALTYPHGVDRYVELVRPLLVGREVRAEIAAVRHQTPSSVTLTLRPNANWRGMSAGQFVGLSVEIDGVRETRPYSPAGSEHRVDRTLELTVSTHPEGKVSRHLRNHARPGMIVGLSEAQGEFVLPRPRPERVLLISGGSGITPVMAMLRTLCDEGLADTGEVGFLNYARSPELALYGPALEALVDRHARLRVARGFTRGAAPPQGGGPGERERREPLSGRFQREHPRAVIAEHADAATFVCGPPALIDAVRSAWARDGLPEPAVETFTPTVPSFDGDAAEGTVSFAASGREAANSGLPLLEQAEDAGLTPDHGCRMGICNTCSCRKTAGTVRNVLTGALSSATEEQIRICVSVPVGDVALDL
ncbi:MAG TPA: ferredoxin reductase [Solirubrobacteraceae bacterium]|nr:ferredoxin reductase [Solirubrobacteraceae bacterium]